MIQSSSMNTEVSAAARFITSTLYGKLPRRRADIFGGEFEIALKKKFQVNPHLNWKKYFFNDRLSDRFTFTKVRPVLLPIINSKVNEFPFQTLVFKT